MSADRQTWPLQTSDSRQRSLNGIAQDPSALSPFAIDRMKIWKK